MKKVVVLGGGISGLAAAYRLSKSEAAKSGELEIVVCEASDHFGGVIESESRDGILIERGPDAFITSKPWALDLCRELGIQNELIGTREEARKSFIFFNGKFFPVPQGFYLMAPTSMKDLARTPLLSWRGKIRAAMEWFIPRRQESGDESLAQFIRRRFGHEILERLAQPLISGIYSADLDVLSLDATFPHFRDMEQKYGSVIRALMSQKDKSVKTASGARYSLFQTFRVGMNRLIQVLIEKMPNVTFLPSKSATRVERGRGWKIYFEDKTAMDADAVCIAMPASKAHELLKLSAPIISQKLNDIPYNTVATVNLVYRKEDLRRPLQGSGYVTAGVERQKVIGCTFSSLKFEGRVQDPHLILIRAFAGGKSFRKVTGLTDIEIGHMVSREVGIHLGISNDPVRVSVSRWTRAMPEYRVGHNQKIKGLWESLEGYPGLYLTGNAYQGSGIPDCIHHGFQTADQILANLTVPSEAETV